MDYVEWVEPFSQADASITLICRLTKCDAIKAQRLSGLARQYEYRDDQQALTDFITVHWARIIKDPPEN